MLRRDKRAPSALVALLLTTLVVAGALSIPAVAKASTLSTDLVDGRPQSASGVPLAALPDVTMVEGALVDADGRMLWGRSPYTHRAMASITKVMTAVVALEHTSPSDIVTVPVEATRIGQSSAGLWAGERLTMQDLLEALLVKSGNDAAITIADHVGGTQSQFVAMMNAKAADLGLGNTHYANPHGLDAPGHYTTPADLGVLARYAMRNPTFADIVRRSSVTIGSGKHRVKLLSTDLLLGMYQGAMGVKTGNTNNAGYSVVSAARRGGITLYAIVLGTKSDRQRFLDAKALLDWGFAHDRPMQLADAGTVVGAATVSSYLNRTVQVAVAQDTTAAVLDTDGAIKREVSVAAIPAPIAKGQQVGVATFRQRGRVVATVPLVATASVGRPNPIEAVWIALVRIWRRIF